MATKKKAAAKVEPAKPKPAAPVSKVPSPGTPGVVLCDDIGPEEYRSAAFLHEDDDGDYVVEVSLHTSDATAKGSRRTIDPEKWHPVGYNPNQGEAIEDEDEGT